MIFFSINFLIFFVVLFSLFLLWHKEWRWVLLLTASYFFYGIWSIEYLVLLVIITLETFFLVHWMESLHSKKKRKLFFILNISIPVLILIFFKYSENIRELFPFVFSGTLGFNLDSTVNIIMPIGLSFYIFKIISYIIDVYNRKINAERHLGYYALYLSFFPQILAGPIERAGDFIPQLKRKVDFNLERVIDGSKQVIWGLFKKMVIADRFAIFVNDMFSSPEEKGIYLLFGIYFYAFQIYCDFSGYTDIAIGITKIFGYKSVKNFDFPYFSKSIVEFWNRWHISLSTWLRDYLFLPIVYSFLRLTSKQKILKMKVESIGYVFAMFITMFLCGVWHGDKWTFVIWGTLHGLFLGISHITRKIRKKFVKKTRLKKFPLFFNLIRVFFVFNLVSFAWVFFRATSVNNAFIYFSNIELKFTSTGSVHIIFYFLILVFFIIAELIQKNREKLIFIKKIPVTVKIISYVFFICIMIVFAIDSSNEFIYFNF